MLGIEVPTAGVPLYTDARHYAAAGIPIVLYGAGPRLIGEANAHNANENLRLEDLRAELDRKLFGDQPPDHVIAAARREWNDQPHRMIGILTNSQCHGR